jgi:V8-like Glu-specific endopeptidase
VSQEFFDGDQSMATMINERAGMKTQHAIQNHTQKSPDDIGDELFVGPQARRTGGYTELEDV